MWRLCVLGAVLALAGCSSAGPAALPSVTPSSHAPSTHAAPSVEVNGSISLTDPYGYTHGDHYAVDSACHGVQGYNDITAAASVVISSDSGRTLAITHLHPGRIDEQQNCTFLFQARVPAGLGFYGVTVSHRGTIKEQESELGDVTLKLG